MVLHAFNASNLKVQGGISMWVSGQTDLQTYTELSRQAKEMKLSLSLTQAH